MKNELISNRRFLGVDTSNYRTSVCLLDRSGKIIYNRRPLLVVPRGKLGLRQQEAVFQHLQVLPSLLEPLGDLQDVSFSVTTRPRPLKDSYMPCFVVGESFIKALAGGRGYLTQSHQENHVFAGIYENPDLLGKPFIVLHLSGGTTEFLLVNWQKDRMVLEKVGGTSDISAGQFLDRVGVALGLPFPAGAPLEKLAEKTDLRLGVTVKDTLISYSGPEAQAKRLLEKKLGDQGFSETVANEVAYAAILAVAKSVSRVLKRLVERHKTNDILLAGGVMANQIIKKRLINDLHRSADLYFTSEIAAGDNALGVAYASYLRG